MFRFTLLVPEIIPALFLRNCARSISDKLFQKATKTMC
jgi:hypothetical protein